MEPTHSPVGPRKKIRSPSQDGIVNPRTCITCTNVPESLFEPGAAEKHFSKFGRVLKIWLSLKRHRCIVDYVQPSSAEQALLNAGAYDGFMFDVTRSKPRVRLRSVKKEDDPDWVPTSDVEEELSAMGATPTYRVTRQNSMDFEVSPPPPKVTVQSPKPKTIVRSVKQTPVKKKLPMRLPVREKPVKPAAQPVSAIEPPLAVTAIQTNLSTLEAAAELVQLRTKTSFTPDEQWRILDARDRIVRAWGGAGSRIKVGGATIGTCQDMCPEKELLQRQAEHQVMTLETVIDSDGELEPWRAVKQYSRSSADQEIPMCYELRPAKVLLRTCAYLLHEIADTGRKVSLADWFHFMWDRLRGIRKDITQQALCCADSIRLVEMCARFHAHCAARLADLEHTQFDQKLNTDNLTKCLQTLKHMYADVSPEDKPREAEFRGYVALLNLGDANFWWEIKQLPDAIQKSSPILFAIKVFNAIDNNNYVRFFRLVRNEATYLQACILLRYFNDVRARGLARIVNAAVRGGSRFPVEDMMRILAFESVENLRCFITHYGLRFSKTDNMEPSVMLYKNQFIEDSDPYPVARAINLIESKMNCSVGEIIAGGELPDTGYSQHVLYTSFTPDGRLKESALVAEDQGYNTINDSNKDVKALKAEIQRLSQGGKAFAIERAPESKVELFVKPDLKSSSPKMSHKFSAPANPSSEAKLFSFKPAIPVAPTEIIKNSPEKIFNTDKNIFSFSKPQETATNNVFAGKETIKSLFDSKPASNIFSKPNIEGQDTPSVFGTAKKDVDVFSKKPDAAQPVFSQTFERKSTGLFGDANKNAFSANAEKGAESQVSFGNKNIFSAKIEQSAENPASLGPKNIFSKATEQNMEKQNAFGSKNIFNTKVEQSSNSQNVFGNKNIFAAKEEQSAESQTSFGSKNIFASAKTDVFAKPDPSIKFGQSGNIFGKPSETTDDAKRPSTIFGAFSKTSESTNSFALPSNDKPQSVFSNGDSANVSPGSLFKSVLNPPNGSDTKSYSIFQSKNKAQTVADNILSSVSKPASVYEFDQNENEDQHHLEMQRLQAERIKEEERKMQEKLMRDEEIRRQELRRQEEERRKEEERKKKEEMKLLEDKRRKEEQRKQEELKRKLEEEKRIELKRKAEEERIFKERVDKESTELTEELAGEINNETVRSIMKEELEKLNNLMHYAGTVSDEVIDSLCVEICDSEMKAEQFLTQKIMRKWFYIWRKQYVRNIQRRNLLDDTPVWLSQNTPLEEALLLRRIVENSALKNMNAIHRGYRFTGEMRQAPAPQPYNIMEIIKSSLLKRMKQISYPYGKCFFWKLTLLSPGASEWLCRKVNLQKWLADAFSDRKKHDVSETLIQVSKQSWNHLMDFAISVSLTSKDNGPGVNEAMDGANALIYYLTENDGDILKNIEETLKYKYPYQVLPLAVIMPAMVNDFLHTSLESLLVDLVKKKTISAYRIFVISSKSVSESLYATSKTAMKWLAKQYPQTPPLEIDYLKSICQRYLGNEIWCKLKSDSRMNVIIKDLHKLIKCYNEAVEKLSDAVTNEDLFNYSSFPLEFQPYLDSTSPYPKPFEFIPSSTRTSDNVSAIKRIMSQLKLPDSTSDFNPVNAVTMHQQITKYCNQIGWFDNPDEVVCKVVAVIPNELSNVSMPCEDFRQYYAHYNLLDFMNIIVYEKINRLKNFENRFAIYEKAIIEDYRHGLWLHDIQVVSELKHKALEYEDEVDYYLEAKRRKIAIESLDCLMLEDNDKTLVEEQIKETDKNISKYNKCAEAVKQLEDLLEEEKLKSLQFENLLKAALDDL